MFLDQSAYRIGSNQIIYQDADQCLRDRAILAQSLESTKPTENSFAITRCIQMISKGVSI
jgi:hypothetical protein